MLGGGRAISSAAPSSTTAPEPAAAARCACPLSISLSGTRIASLVLSRVQQEGSTPALGLAPRVGSRMEAVESPIEQYGFVAVKGTTPCLLADIATSISRDPSHPTHHTSHRCASIKPRHTRYTRNSPPPNREPSKLTRAPHRTRERHRAHRRQSLDDTELRSQHRRAITTYLGHQQLAHHLETLLHDVRPNPELPYSRIRSIGIVGTNASVSLAGLKYRVTYLIHISPMLAYLARLAKPSRCTRAYLDKGSILVVLFNHDGSVALGFVSCLVLPSLSFTDCNRTIASAKCLSPGWWIKCRIRCGCRCWPSTMS